jgi:AraC-like DNA-binding protein
MKHLNLVSIKPAAAHISDIAFAWGFNDLAHFSRIFKQKFGASPREWRKHPTH